MSDQRADQRSVQDTASGRSRTATPEASDGAVPSVRRMLANPRRTRR